MRLGVFDVVGIAVAALWHARRDFLILATPPVVLTTLAWAILSSRPDRAPWTAFLIETAIWLIALSSFAVIWHRHYLIAAERPTIADILRWDMRKTRYGARLTGLTAFLMMLGGVAFMISMQAAILLGTVWLPLAIAAMATLPIFCRLGLAFPAMAVGARGDFRSAVLLGRGNTVPLMAITILILGASYLASFGFGFLWTLVFGDMTPSDMSVMGWIVAIPGYYIDWAGIALLTTAYSHAYLRLSEAADAV